MSKPYYVKFEISKDLVNAVYEAVRVAKQSGKVRKGTNETTNWKAWLGSSADDHKRLTGA